jgi:hypothetical protein
MCEQEQKEQRGNWKHKKGLAFMKKVEFRKEGEITSRKINIVVVTSI